MGPKQTKRIQKGKRKSGKSGKSRRYRGGTTEKEIVPAAATQAATTSAPSKELIIETLNAAEQAIKEAAVAFAAAENALENPPEGGNTAAKEAFKAAKIAFETSTTAFKVSKESFQTGSQVAPATTIKPVVTGTNATGASGSNQAGALEGNPEGNASQAVV